MATVAETATNVEWQAVRQKSCGRFWPPFAAPRHDAIKNAFLNSKSPQQKPAKLHGTEERRRRKLVRRSHFMTIVAAWIVTVPASALLSALVFLAIGLVMGS